MRCMSVFSDELKDVDGRLDPPVFVAITNPHYRKLRSSKYPVKRLGELASLVTKGESPLWRGNPFTESGIPFLRAKNIKAGRVDFEDIVYIDPKTHEGMKRSVLNEELLLLTMAGTLGDVAHFKPEFPESNINQDIAKIKLNDDGLTYEYANVYFQTEFAKSQIPILSNGGTRGHLNFEKIKSFKVVSPPASTQNEIVSVLESAYETKRKKEAEAEWLLNSIDDFVLGELEIEMPEIKPRMSFSVTLKKIDGGRLAADYYQPKYDALEASLHRTKARIVNLGDLIDDISGGATPRIEGDAYADQSGVPFLRVQNIKREGIVLDDVKFIKREIHEGELKRSKLNANHIVFTITGRIGSIAIVPEGFEGNINQHSVRMSLKEELDGLRVKPHYVPVYFNTIFANLLVLREVTGGTRPALDYTAIKSLKIPIPPPELQKKIIAGANRIFQDAQRLKQEAQAELEAAKARVEKMILGKES